MKERAHLGDLGIDGIIIVRCILKIQQVVKMQTGFSWFWTTL
jgi:hypothetical protein